MPRWHLPQATAQNHAGFAAWLVRERCRALGIDVRRFGDVTRELRFLERRAQEAVR